MKKYSFTSCGRDQIHMKYCNGGTCTCMCLYNVIKPFTQYRSINVNKLHEHVTLESNLKISKA